MDCKFLIVSSITYALKAKSELENNSIECRIEKIKNIAALKGCGYGIRINRRDVQMSVRLLKSLHIRVIDVIDCENDAI